MANNFNKEEVVIFEKMVEEFDDGMVFGKEVDLMSMPSARDMERSADKIWMLKPQIATLRDGYDQTGQFGDTTELVVPMSINPPKSHPFNASPQDLRDEHWLNNKRMAATQAFGSAINASIQNQVALFGTIFSKRTGVATGFDDLAEIEAMCDETGVQRGDRKVFYSTRDYNRMASNLANRSTFSDKSAEAYNKAIVPGGTIAGFDVYKNDTAVRLALAAGGAITVAGAGQKYVPVATSTDAAGNISNVDNRTQLLTVSATAGVKPGDAFTLPGVNSLHMIKKTDTGQLKTFRVISVVSGTVLQIAPAMVVASGGTRAEIEYANVTATPANGAVVTWLNTATGLINPFYRKGVLGLMPGTFVVDPQDGWMTMSATTALGINITYTRQGDINNLNVKARYDARWGTVLLDYEQAGVQMFSQP